MMQYVHRLVKERNLNKAQVDEFYAILGEKLKEYMKDTDVLTQSVLLFLSEDAVDMALTRSSARSSQSVLRAEPKDITIDPTAYTAQLDHVGDDATGYMAKHDHTGDDAKTKPLRRVNIYEDPGIWICLDEGCNSNCHGDAWAENTDQKLAKLNISRPCKNGELREFEWISKVEKTFQGIGPNSVKTFGKRKLPSYLKLLRGQAISLQIESHQQN